ncbi:cupin domain-containing protein [Paenibacillus sp. CGMCC 1.16610]|uniref:Cupin domain-containing protein n=1 Tax=Paenibacillus anseongense TaxID=2682845 RepID=A0ABW9UCJ7_9BACL|nr:MULTISPECIES: cupin domain-containing protein [Paenibacillus]MBA2937668.1 cupin domain-containing protein [Paenibacillus sp. CGMCC 1.16610]MVQ36726.1 cupin domain-containing protein [Paenibacillus anseongense]
MSSHAINTQQSQVGKDFWYLGTLMTVKADAVSTNNSFGMVECSVPVGFEPPYHIHQEEDESFYILDGEVDFFLDGKKIEAKAGAFVFLPKGIAHGLRVVGSKPARLLNFFSRAEFLGMFLEMAEPALKKELPPPAPIDVPRLLQLSEKYNAVTLGPLDQFVK